MESAYIIQRTATINDARASLRLSFTAMATDGSRDISTEDTSRALRTMRGVGEGTFIIVPFYPKNFMIHCHSREVWDLLLATLAMPIATMALVLRPWTRLAHAELATMKFKVLIELEGLSPHAWVEDKVAKILAPSCWVHIVDPSSTNKTGLSSFKLAIWTCDPRAIPKVVCVGIF